MEKKQAQLPRDELEADRKLRTAKKSFREMEKTIKAFPPRKYRTFSTAGKWVLGDSLPRSLTGEKKSPQS